MAVMRVCGIVAGPDKDRRRKNARWADGRLAVEKSGISSLACVSETSMAAAKKDYLKIPGSCADDGPTMVKWMTSTLDEIDAQLKKNGFTTGVPGLGTRFGTCGSSRSCCLVCNHSSEID